MCEEQLCFVLWLTLSWLVSVLWELWWSCSNCWEVTHSRNNSATKKFLGFYYFFLFSKDIYTTHLMTKKALLILLFSFCLVPSWRILPFDNLGCQNSSSVPLMHSDSASAPSSPQHIPGKSNIVKLARVVRPYPHPLRFATWLLLLQAFQAENSIQRKQRPYLSLHPLENEEPSPTCFPADSPSCLIGLIASHLSQPC